MVIILCRFCKSSKSLRHREFPGGLPSKYYSGPTMLDFRNRTRTGVFIEVWSQTLFCCWFAGVMLYAILRFICQTGLILCKKGIILNSHKKLMRGATVVLGLKRQQKVSSFQKCHQIAAIFQPFRSCRLLQAYMRVSEIKTMVIILCRFCKSSKSLRHRGFPGGTPSKYYSGPTMLDFRDRTRTGVFIVVWSQTLFWCWFAGVMLYAILRFICQTGLILCKKGTILNSHKKLMRGATVVLGLKRQQKVSSFQKCHQIAAIFQPFRSWSLLQAYMRVSEIKTMVIILCRFCKSSKSLRHREFPGGPPSQYYSRPTMLDFRDRTRTGVFIVVRSQISFCCWFAGVMLYAILRFICQTGLILCKNGIILNSHKKLMRGATVVLRLK